MAKRYTKNYDDLCRECTDIVPVVEDNRGEWVLYEDYKELEEKLKSTEVSVLLLSEQVDCLIAEM